MILGLAPLPASVLSQALRGGEGCVWPGQPQGQNGLQGKTISLTETRTEE